LNDLGSARRRWATLAVSIAVAVLGATAAAMALAPDRRFGPPEPPPVLAFSHAAGPRAPSAVARTADYGELLPSVDTRRLVDWVLASDDHGSSVFIVVDKRAAVLYLFDGQARLQASSPVLLGAALGDASVPGIGVRPLALVRPEERTTPAGRFVAERGRNAQGEDVVWVDYDAAVSMHRVRATQPRERRLQRLATPSADDNRISYGCINVPVAFYDRHIAPTFARQRALVYVLPDTATLQQIFGMKSVGAVQRQDRRGAVATHG
jgi:hypothetical protein